MHKNNTTNIRNNLSKESNKNAGAKDFLYKQTTLKNINKKQENNDKNHLIIDIKHKKTDKIKVAEKRVINLVKAPNLGVKTELLQKNNLNERTSKKTLEKAINSNLKKKDNFEDNKINKTLLKTNIITPLTLKVQNHSTKIDSLQSKKSITIGKLVSTASRPSLIKTGSNISQKNKPRWI